MHARTAAGLLGGRYRIDDLLGEGGMARVLGAFDERLERGVAVKVLRPETEALPGMRERFQQEARIAARLVHPNIVAVLDYGEDDGWSYLVMERLPGATLRDEIVRGPVSQRRLAQVTSDTLAALAAAHRRGVLHRDIKPSNILLQQDGHAKLADFGIAKSFDAGAGLEEPRDDLTLTGIVLGTPGYLAPERRSGRPATVQSDLYSVGAVMVEAATGRRALSDVAATPDVLISPFRDVAHRALADDPAARFGSAEEMRRALRVSAPPRLRSRPAQTPTQPVETLARTGPAPTVDGPTRTATMARPPVSPDGAAAVPRHHHRRTLALAALALGALAVALFVALSQGSHPTGPAATAATHHATHATVQRQTTTTTTQDPEVTAIDTLATTLGGDGFPGDAALAAALETTAAQPAGAAREAAAVQTLALARVLLDGGGITRTEYVEVETALQPTGALPGATSSPSGGLPGGGHGHGHGPGPGDQG